MQNEKLIAAWDKIFEGWKKPAEGWKVKYKIVAESAIETIGYINGSPARWVVSPPDLDADDVGIYENGSPEGIFFDDSTGETWETKDGKWEKEYPDMSIRFWSCKKCHEQCCEKSSGKPKNKKCVSDNDIDKKVVSKWRPWYTQRQWTERDRNPGKYQHLDDADLLAIGGKPRKIIKQAD